MERWGDRGRCSLSGVGQGLISDLGGFAGRAVFPTGQVGQAAAKPSLAYGNSLGPRLARAYRLCRA